MCPDLDEVFDEVYPSKGEVKRFDQGMSAFRLMAREGRIMEYNNEENRVKWIGSGTPGYSVVDYAFKDAAGMYDSLPWCTGHMNQGFYSWTPLGVGRKPESVPKWEGSPEKAAKIITKAGKFFGAVGVGFTKLDKRWVYSKSSDGREIVFEDVEEAYVTEEKYVIPDSHTNVIAITVPMELIENSYAPTILEVTSNMGYSRMQITAGQVAEFIRGMGWNAIPCGNDTGLSVPIAIQAGLGHVGRHGRLITWEHGPMVRICKIFTDLPLPQSPLAPKGIIEYCEVCEKCAMECPSGSIPMGPRTYEGHNEANNPGVLRWFCDGVKCLEYWNVVGSGCSICFRTCSFTKPRGLTHGVVKWFIRNVPQLNKLWVWSDDFLEYGKMSDPSEYWDLPYRNR